MKQLLLLVYDLENLFPVCYKVLICRCLVDVDLRQLPDETSLMPIFLPARIALLSNLLVTYPASLLEGSAPSWIKNDAART